MTPRFLSRWLPALALSITVASLVAACGGGAAKPAPVVPDAPPDELTRTITGLDRAFFNAFNGCDLEKLAQQFDVQF